MRSLLNPDFETVTTDDSITKDTPVHDVRAWGAEGDGSTDDAPAIQDAIDAATAAGGGTLFFPEAETGYLIDTTVTPKSNVWYTGEGWPRLMAGDLGDNAMFENTGGVQNVRWTGLELDGSAGWTQDATYHFGKKAIFLTPSASGADDLRDVRVQNCYVHDTPATALGIDSCINDWYIGNRIEGAGTDGETQGSNGIGVGVGEADFAPTYIFGNTIIDTAEYAIILEQTGDTRRTDGGHWIGGNTPKDFKYGVGVEQIAGANLGENTYVGSSRSEMGLEIDAIDGQAPTDVTATGATFVGNFNKSVWVCGSGASRVSVSNWTKAIGGVPDISTDNCVANGVGKTSAGVAGTPNTSDWGFASPCHVRNVDDETLWRVQFGTVEQLSYGEPVDLGSNAGQFDGQVGFNDGTTGTRGLAEWDTSLASESGNWRSQVDGTTFGPN